jgi:hypothetical protein
MKDRLDESKLGEFEQLPLPSPVHALNLVEFRDERSYRLYGLLLLPLALARGVAPVWAGVLVMPVRGKA